LQEISDKYMAINLNGTTGFGTTGAANSLGLVGVKANAPGSNVQPQQNTLPNNQQPSITDLSSKFAKVNLNGNPTIYNKGTGQAYSDPQSFFKDSGVSSFNNVKFDTAWQPASQTTSQVTPQSTPQNTQQNYSNNSNQYAASTAPFTSTPTPETSTAPATTATGAPATQTPPNSGTTGVSQGGIIGGVINNASNNPAYQQAINEYNAYTPQIQALQASEQNQLTNAGMDSGNMDLALGRQGQITQNIGGLIGSLVQAQAQKLAAANAALAAQGQTNTGLGTAGQLNAPIIANPGQVQISPSQPTPGATTSGAANLNSLLSIKNINGNPTYVSSTGQQFSTPQQLADFVNQQVPGANVNASSVFDYIKNNGQGGSNIIGGNSALNPLSNVQSTAQAVANGTLSYQDALTAGGNIPNYANVLQQAIQQIRPGFNFNTAQGNSAAQTATANTQGQQQAQYTSAKQQANNLSQQFTNLLGTYGLNPSDINKANSVIQTIAANTSDWRYQALNNYISDIVNTYAQILTPPGATTTDYTKTQAANMLSALASGQSLQNTIASIDQQAQAKIAGVQTNPITNSQNNTSSSNLYNF
jgi:hypothetical protein